MPAEAVTATLLHPTAKSIRDTKLQMWRDWEEATGEPGEIRVYRVYDLERDCPSAVIVVRSSVPRGFRWGKQ